MKPLGFGIIGCGKIAPRHGEAIAQLPNARLVAACDSVRQRAESFALQYQATPYTEVEDLLSDPRVDVVILATPSGTHAPLAVRAARAGKHLLIEKPLALTLEDCWTVDREAEHTGVKLAVVHPNRFLPAVVALRKALDAGNFGKISHGSATLRWFRPQHYYDGADWRGTRAMDGGVLFNQAIHSIDLMQWMLGPVEWVQGATATRLRSIEAEDVGAAVVKFRSGALGVIEASATVYPQNLEETLGVFGENGTALIGGRTIGRGVRAWQFATEVPLPEVTALPPHWGHQQVIADLVDAVTRDRPPAVGAAEAAKSISLVLAIYDSASTGRAAAPQALGIKHPTTAGGRRP